MYPILVVVNQVLPDQPLKMGLVQQNDVVEKFTAAISHPAFGDTTLPGRSHAGSL